MLTVAGVQGFGLCSACREEAAGAAETRDHELLDDKKLQRLPKRNDWL